MSERHLIIGPCRSGTTMLLRCAKNHPGAVVEFQTIKAGQRRTGTPDYTFYDRPVPAGKFLVNKETVGYGTHEDCTLKVFPNDEAICKTRPVFIFREPRDTFVSWIENNLVPKGSTDLFIQAYRHTFALLLHARSISSNISVVTYEALCGNAEKSQLRTICDKWEITFHPDMIDWKDNFIDTTPLDKEGIEAGHYAALSRDSAIRAQAEKSTLSEAHSREIISALDSLYQQIRALSL